MKPSKLHFQSYAFLGKTYGLLLKNETLYVYSSFMLGSDELPKFLDEIIEQFPYEGDFVLIRMFIKDQIPVADILGRFIRESSASSIMSTV